MNCQGLCQQEKSAKMAEYFSDAFNKECKLTINTLKPRDTAA
jgi:hypothetical protein